MRKNKKLSKGILNSVVTTTVAVTPLAVGAITAVTFAETGLMVVNATEVSAAAATNQSGIDAISANNGQYTVTSEHTNFKWTDILKNPIIVLKMTDGSYKYKKFSDPVTVDKAKAAYAAGEFVDAATYKVANGPLQADDKVYIIQESDFTTDPTSISIEESYDLTKFHHRQNLVLGGDNFFEGATIDDAASDSVLVALARPGSFVSEIEFKNANNPGTPSIYLPEENNTLLVVDNIREAVEQAGPNDQSYKNFGLFLSHIAVSDDKVNKPNTVMKLPEGVEVVFADSSGQQTTFAGAMNEIMAALQYDPDDWTVLNPQQKLKFKFIVKKDGQIIQEDKNWREITLHVYNTSDAVKNLVKTTLENTENNFAEGIVDNIDFSGLPEVMKNEAVEMERKYPNVDGSTPQDGTLPQFSNPDNKQYNWINKDEETSNGNHATSPARYFPYDMDLFQGDGDDITEALRGYIPYINAYPPTRDSGEPAKIEPSDHDKELIDYYSLGPIFAKTMFGHNFTPELGGVNESYWNSLVQDIPIPQLDFEPKVNLDIVTLSISTPPSTPPSESKGNVVVKHYKEGTTDEVKDGRTTAEQVVGENYDVSGDKVTGRFTGKDGKTYEYVSTQGNPTDTIKEGTTEVIYYYKEVPSTQPGGNTPGGNTPGGNTPGGNTPGGNTPGGNTPGGNTPGGNTPGGNTPGGNTPGGNTPGGNTPGGNTPGGNTPGGNTPGGNTPGGNTPGGNTPGGNTPGGNTPGGNTPGEPTPPTPGTPTPGNPGTPTPPTGTITVTPKAGPSQLPNTGEASTSPLYGVLSLVTGLAGLFGLVKKKKEEDQ
ncbi:LPXTG cell wall anchor domain-containing protein [Streptococcus suis]|nr:LPXTG cell wall anchor domain-containing protein [Streptococcus suis]